MEHCDLISEMPYIEKLSTQERLKLARRRRVQQLKRWSQKEKESLSTKQEKTASNEVRKKQRKFLKNVFFAGNVMLLEAAARNDIDEVKALLEKNVNADSTNEDGLTALHQCCIDDSEEMMRLLVQYGANVNATDSEKWTPLHAAATCGHLHLAKFLIEKNANLLAVNADGNMPYDICEDDATLDYIEGEMATRGITQELIDDTRATVENKMLEDLMWMKKDGQSLICRDGYGATPLHVSAANGYITVIEYLLSQNVPTEIRDYDDWTPLHAAACWGHPDVLEMLVQHGANLQSRTKNQETPYDICEDMELRERIMQLVNELETKRFHDQSRRVRRVRSNKRTQSIRRTSIRERTLTAKKEAQDEARLRIQLENKYLNDDNPSLPDVCLSNSIKQSTSTHIVNDVNFPNSSDDADEAISDKIDVLSADENDNDKVINGTVELSVADSVVPLRRDAPPVPPPRSSSVKPLTDDIDLTNTRENSNKIDIHVTVTVNPFSPGTLSDLKKQRALSRASQNSYTLTGPSNMFSVNATHDQSESVEPNEERTQSPALSPRRFCGEPSDLIGRSNRWACCVIM